MLFCVRSFVHSFVCLFVLSFFCPFVRSFVSVFVFSLFVYSFFRSFVRLFVCLFVRSSVRLLVRSFVRSFVHSFVSVFVFSLFVCSFVFFSSFFLSFFFTFLLSLLLLLWPRIEFQIWRLSWPEFFVTRLTRYLSVKIIFENNCTNWRHNKIVHDFSTQVNFLQEDSSMSLSSLSALDGVKQEVQFNNISLDMIYCIRIVCWHFWRLINVFFWGESHLCQYAPYILANICEKKWKEKRRRIRSKRREKKKNVSRFETATWQLLACVLTQLAIDLVTAERKTREFWVESQPDPSFPHFFTPPIPSRLVLLTEGLEQATIWISVWDFSDLVPPSPPPGKKRNQERVKSWPISWSTFC